MWWSMVVPARGQRPEDGIKIGSWNGDVMGDREAKKAAKAAGRDYIRHGGPGQPRLIKSPQILAGSIDLTPGARPATAAQAETESEASDDDDALFEHILSGRDVFEGSPFYGDHPDDVLEQMELLFRDSGWAVVGYACGLDNINEEPEPRIAGLMGFGGVTAQAEFWKYCRRRDPEATDRWVEGRYEAMLAAFTQSGRVASDEAAALVPEAKEMIVHHWEKVMMLATAKLDDSMEVDGREVKFLRDIYGDPQDDEGGQ